MSEKRYWRCKTCGLVWLYRPEASWSAGCPKCSNPMEPVEVWPEGTVAKLREALMAACPPGDDWWCPTCQTGLHGSRVTHDERCDTCGTYLGYETPGWVTAARAALAATEAKG